MKEPKQIPSDPEFDPVVDVMGTDLSREPTFRDQAYQIVRNGIRRRQKARRNDIEDDVE